jgi:glucose/arabinose dehydrogenase
MTAVKTLLSALLFMVLSSQALAGVQGSAYASNGKCGPFPRAAVTTPKGICVGIVAGPDQGLKMPRLIQEWRPGRFILTDMAGWVGKGGRVLGLDVDSGKVSIRTIFSGLAQPHGLAMGPDKKIYVGEKGRIWRFDPAEPAPKMETVATDLPADGRHPLLNMVFAADGALIVNIGAPSDRCEAKPGAAKPQNPCLETQGDRPRAALWRLSFDKPGGAVAKTEPLARGLRNSMALAVDPATGALIQGENGVDLPGEDEPFEELNLIVAGKHYGWPHCHGKNTPFPGAGVTAAFCKETQGAAILLPPHSAPLGMIVYSGQLIPALKGKLVIGLHGYRKYGRRIVALDVAAVTSGNGALTDVVSGWDRKRGLRPQGGPVGLSQSADGGIWFVEDKNKTVMVLLSDGGVVTKSDETSADAVPPPPAPKGWASFVHAVVKPKCAVCHAEAKATSPDAIWVKMVEAGWAGDGPLKDSKLARTLLGAGPEKPMPPPAGLKTDAAGMAALKELLAENP